MSDESQSKPGDHVADGLKWSLQALASDAPTQAGLFPAFVVVADELALEFDEALRLATDRSDVFVLTDEQRAALQAIDARLHAMSRGGPDFSPSLWTLDGLGSDRRWAQVRALALQALSSLGWPYEPPPPSRHTYVPG